MLKRYLRSLFCCRQQQKKLRLSQFWCRTGQGEYSSFLPECERSTKPVNKGALEQRGWIFVSHNGAGGLSWPYAGHNLKTLSVRWTQQVLSPNRAAPNTTPAELPAPSDSANVVALAMPSTQRITARVQRKNSDSVECDKGRDEKCGVVKGDRVLNRLEFGVVPSDTGKLSRASE